jgi:hypothetical protein
MRQTAGSPSTWRPPDDVLVYAPPGASLRIAAASDYDANAILALLFLRPTNQHSKLAAPFGASPPRPETAMVLIWHTVPPLGAPMIAARVRSSRTIIRPTAHDPARY